MPNLVEAAIPGSDFFHRMSIGVGVRPSAAGQAQTIAAVTAVDQPGQQGFRAGAKRCTATLTGARLPQFLCLLEQLRFDDAELWALGFYRTIDEIARVALVLYRA